MGKFDNLKKKVGIVADKATDKAKDVADKDADKAKDVADKAADKAKDLAEISKLNISLADKKKDLEKAYAKIGKGYFFKDADLDTSEAYYEAVRLNTEIEMLQNQIDALKNKEPQEEEAEETAEAKETEEAAEVVEAEEVKEEAKEPEEAKAEEPKEEAPAEENIDDLIKCIKD